MNQSTAHDRSGRASTLFAIAAVIAAFALLVLAVSVMVYAVGWYAGCEVAGISDRAPITAGDGPSGAGDEAAAVTGGAGSPIGAAAPPATPPGEAEVPPVAGAPASDLPVVEVPGGDVVATVQDWRPYTDTAGVEADIERNLGAGGANTMTLTLLDPWSAPGAQGGIAIDYAIGEDAPDDFVGFNRTFPAAQDWRGATHLALWVDPGTTTLPDFVVQFREQSGEVWRYAGSTAEIPVDGPIVLPLEASTFAWQTWSTKGNGRVDLATIDQYGLYVGHVGPEITGTLRVGPLAAVTAPR